METGEGKRSGRIRRQLTGVWSKLLFAVVGMVMILPLFVLRAEAGYVFYGEDCSDFCYYASDGSTVKMTDFSEDAVVLIFGRESCFNCKTTARFAASVAKSPTSVKVVFLKIDNSSPDPDYTWEDHVASLGKYIELTKYDMYQNQQAYWSLENIRLDLGNTLPRVLILDKNRKMVDCYNGLDTDRLMKGIEKVTTNEYVAPQYTSVYTGYSGMITLKTGESRKLKQEFTPSNSFAIGEFGGTNPDIISVSKDGVVTGLKPGDAYVYYYAGCPYSLALVRVEKGIIAPDGIKLDITSKTAVKGNTFTLKETVTPADADNKSVKWSSSNPAVATVDQAGKVTCKAAGKAVITAATVNNLKANCEVFVLAEDNPSNPFADVASGGWEYDAARFVYDRGYMNGQGELVPGKVIFSPYTPITRAQFVRTLYNVEGSPSVAYVQKFSDVKSGQWYSNSITWAEQNGIVGGYSNGKFGINDTATREQLAMMFYKYAKYKGYSTTVISGKGKRVSDFPDANDVSTWAVEPLNWALSRGILGGKGSGKLDPKGNATRVECAVILRNFRNAYLKNALGLYDEDYVFPDEPEGILEEDSVIQEVEVEIPEQDTEVPDQDVVVPKQDVEEPEVTEPEVTEPEVTKPEVTKPEVEEPEVVEPEVTEPEVEEPEVVGK